ncbi:hypothetical protein AB0D78_32470 [Streptomyces avermitilis]|uniref:hypothetical protein n=1 Tax=Streptomyces avermitilis TaxID=33903 RepID=UPI003401EED8
MTWTWLTLLGPSTVMGTSPSTAPYGTGRPITPLESASRGRAASLTTSRRRYGAAQLACQPKNPRHRGQYQWSRTGDRAAVAIQQVQPHLRVKQEQARIALQVQDIVVNGRGVIPYPEMPVGYDPGPLLARLRDEVVQVLNQDRRMPLSSLSAADVAAPESVSEELRSAG